MTLELEHLHASASVHTHRRQLNWVQLGVNAVIKRSVCIGMLMLQLYIRRRASVVCILKRYCLAPSRGL